MLFLIKRPGGVCLTPAAAGGESGPTSGDTCRAEPAEPQVGPAQVWRDAGGSSERRSESEPARI